MHADRAIGALRQYCADLCECLHTPVMLNVSAAQLIRLTYCCWHKRTWWKYVHSAVRLCWVMLAAVQLCAECPYLEQYQAAFLECKHLRLNSACLRAHRMQTALGASERSAMLSRL
jgi:hypothetical protein